MADDMAKRFANNTTERQLTVLHDDGLYRHLRFQRPETGMYRFDLVTWPGYLTICGDIRDSYTFTRLPEMFEFFRGPVGQINAHYWSEKLDGGRRSAKTYSPDAFRQVVTEHFVDAVQCGGAPRGLGKAVREDILRSEFIGTEGDAREVLDAFEYKGFQFEDTWEWGFHDYDWSFLWACHAIVWGIGQYDSAREATLVAAGGAS